MSEVNKNAANDRKKRGYSGNRNCDEPQKNRRKQRRDKPQAEKLPRR
ncbi:MAG: hypothetical protein ACLVB1_10210 [Blautia obeum]